MTLEAKDLRFAYRRKGKPVLQQVNFCIESGERVGLAAPSGFGKTTLCKLLAGYMRPDQGQILLDGQPLPTGRGVCPVQMLWQHPELALDPRLRLRASLEEAGADEPELLEALHIELGWLDRFPTELSGGELQRFCLMRALRPSVRFLLCDEISAMLDLVTQAQIWDFLLREADRRGLGLLIVSHQSELLKRICTRMIELPGQ